VYSLSTRNQTKNATFRSSTRAVAIAPSERVRRHACVGRRTPLLPFLFATLPAVSKSLTSDPGLDKRNDHFSGICVHVRQSVKRRPTLVRVKVDMRDQMLRGRDREYSLPFEPHRARSHLSRHLRAAPFKTRAQDFAP